MCQKAKHFEKTAKTKPSQNFTPQKSKTLTSLRTMQNVTKNKIINKSKLLGNGNHYVTLFPTQNPQFPTPVGSQTPSTSQDTRPDHPVPEIKTELEDLLDSMPSQFQEEILGSVDDHQWPTLTEAMLIQANIYQATPMEFKHQIGDPGTMSDKAEKQSQAKAKKQVEKEVKQSQAKAEKQVKKEQNQALHQGQSKRKKIHHKRYRCRSTLAEVLTLMHELKDLIVETVITPRQQPAGIQTYPL